MKTYTTVPKKSDSINEICKVNQLICPQTEYFFCRISHVKGYRDWTVPTSRLCTVSQHILQVPIKSPFFPVLSIYLPYIRSTDISTNLHKTGFRSATVFPIYTNLRDAAMAEAFSITISFVDGYSFGQTSRLVCHLLEVYRLPRKAHHPCLE